VQGVALRIAAETTEAAHNLNVSKGKRDRTLKREIPTSMLQRQRMLEKNNAKAEIQNCAICGIFFFSHYLQGLIIILNAILVRGRILRK
jgi:hypothetical protein